jgi:UPF0716 protein FxsA
MFRALFLLFIIVPIVEIALLIQVSDVIGGWNTIALVIITAFLGARLVKQQGADTLKNVQLQMANGQMPAAELFNGLCIVIAGVLLLTPGIATDITGFLLLTPLVRKSLASKLMSHAKVHVASGMHQQYSSTSEFYSQQQSPFSTKETVKTQSSSTIEGEYIRKD